MNIFYLDHDPAIAATMHLDKHVVKMVLEYAQLLSTAQRLLSTIPPVTVYRITRGKVRAVEHRPLPGDMIETVDGLPSLISTHIYRATHANHPCAMWVRESTANYRWTHDLLSAVTKEYTHRYGKVHKVEHSGLLHDLTDPPPALANHQPTPVPLAMPDEYKASCPVEAYRRYYCGAKGHLLKYTNRSWPTWINKSEVKDERLVSLE